VFFAEVVKGRHHAAAVLGNGRVARLTYDYVVLFGVVSCVVNQRWAVVGRDPADDEATTRAEIERTHDVVLTELNLWTRFSLPAAVVLSVLVAAVVEVLR